MTPLAPHVTAFFQQRLPVERRASPHTSDSYAYAFKLLLEYASERLHVRPSALHLGQIDAPFVVASCVVSDIRNGASSNAVRGLIR